MNITDFINKMFTDNILILSNGNRLSYAQQGRCITFTETDSNGFSWFSYMYIDTDQLTVIEFPNYASTINDQINIMLRNVKIEDFLL